MLLKLITQRTKETTMNYKSRLFCTLITFLLMTSLSQATDLNNFTKLLSLEFACERAQNASTAIDLQEAVTSFQNLAIETGMASNKSYIEYLQTLNARLADLRQVTTIETVNDETFRENKRKSSELLLKVKAEYDSKLHIGATPSADASSCVELGADFRKSLDEQQELLNKVGTVQKAAPVKEPKEETHKRAMCYEAVIKEIGAKKASLNDEVIKNWSVLAVSAMKSVMPNHDQIWAYVLCAKDTGRISEEEKLFTQLGYRVFRKIQQDEKLKSWLKNAVVIDGRTDEKSKCSNRLELVLSSTPGGPQEASAIFFLEGDRIKFHDIWIKKGVLGKAENTFVHEDR